MKNSRSHYNYKFRGFTVSIERVGEVGNFRYQVFGKDEELCFASGYSFTNRIDCEIAAEDCVVKIKNGKIR